MHDSPPKLSLRGHFQSITDPRVNRTKAHDLIDSLVSAIGALRCGAETDHDRADFGRAKQAWFKTFLRLRNGIPDHDTFNRVVAALDGNALRRAAKANNSTPAGSKPICSACWDF